MFYFTQITLSNSKAAKQRPILVLTLPSKKLLLWHEVVSIKATFLMADAHEVKDQVRKINRLLLSTRLSSLTRPLSHPPSFP